MEKLVFNNIKVITMDGYRNYSEPHHNLCKILLLHINIFSSIETLKITNAKKLFYYGTGASTSTSTSTSIVSDIFSNMKIKNFTLCSSDDEEHIITRQIFVQLPKDNLVGINCNYGTDNVSTMIKLLGNNPKIKKCTFYLDAPCIDYISYLSRTNLKVIHTVFNTNFPSDEIYNYVIRMLYII